MPDNERDHPQLPLEGAGQRLVAAREAAGLSRAELAQITRISERLLAQMEEGNFASLPSRTYAIGFTRSYARAVGLDENAMIDAVRHELGISAPGASAMPDALEPGDPARIPSARFAWWLAFGALILAAAGLFVWRTYLTPAVTLPSILPEETPTIAPTFATQAQLFPAPSGSPDPAASGIPLPMVNVAPTLGSSTPSPRPAHRAARPAVEATVEQSPSPSSAQASTISN